MPRHNKECPICKIIFSTYVEKQICCRRKCSGIYHSGENNPNYGKKWDDEQKKKQGEIIKSKVDDEYRERCGSANRGIKFSQERIDAMHKHRDSSSYSRPHTDETKIVIGRKSSEKFTEEYKSVQRQKFIDLGYWISDEDRDDYEIYVIHSEWIESMWNLADPVLLETLKIFNSKSNPNGLVRDHKLSRKCGFDNKIFPEILRHPVNCSIITHSENSSKREKSSITIEELFINIETYIGEWKEQELVLALINKWKNGERFSANDYRRKSHASNIFGI